MQIDTRNRECGVTVDDVGNCTPFRAGVEPRSARWGRSRPARKTKYLLGARRGPLDQVLPQGGLALLGPAGVPLHVALRRRRGHLRVGRFYNCLLRREAGRLAARGRAGHGRRAPEAGPLRRARRPAERVALVLGQDPEVERLRAAGGAAAGAVPRRHSVKGRRRGGAAAGRDAGAGPGPRVVSARGVPRGGLSPTAAVAPDARDRRGRRRCGARACGQVVRHRRQGQARTALR